MEPFPNPDMNWYLNVSRERGVTPRCPFAAVERCPRFYESLSLMGHAGGTKIASDDDARLKAKWEKSDLWPVTAEMATSISGVEGHYTGFWKFCPEVLYERFGYFVADRVDHVAGLRPVFNRVTGLKDSWGK